MGSIHVFFKYFIYRFGRFDKNIITLESKLNGDVMIHR